MRNYRDNVLRKTETGRKMIRLYYTYSPVLSDKMKHDEVLRQKVSEAVNGILQLLKVKRQCAGE